MARSSAVSRHRVESHRLDAETIRGTSRDLIPEMTGGPIRATTVEALRETRATNREASLETTGVEGREVEGRGKTATTLTRTPLPHHLGREEGEMSTHGRMMTDDRMIDCERDSRLVNAATAAEVNRPGHAVVGDHLACFCQDYACADLTLYIHLSNSEHFMTHSHIPQFITCKICDTQGCPTPRSSLANLPAHHQSSRDVTCHRL